MPKTKKESLVFTMIMCAFMVFFMSIYNITLHEKGFSSTTLLYAITGFIPGYLCGMICDWFIVSKPAKAIAFKFLNEEDKPIKKGLIISFFMVCGMVLSMSMYGAIVNVGITKQLPMAYITGVAKNFIVALPLQLLIVGPIVRFLFAKIYPQQDKIHIASN